MRVVLVLPDAPLGFGNAASRWYSVLLKGLVQRGHQVTAYAACGTEEDAAAAQTIFPQSHYDLRCYPAKSRTGPLAKWNTLTRPYEYLFSPALRRDLDSRLNGEFDVLHLEQLWAGWLGRRHSERAAVNVHYLLALDRAASKPV